MSLTYPTAGGHQILFDVGNPLVVLLLPSLLHKKMERFAREFNPIPSENAGTI
jgi:hypothetical protein